MLQVLLRFFCLMFKPYSVQKLNKPYFAVVLLTDIQYIMIYCSMKRTLMLMLLINILAVCGVMAQQTKRDSVIKLAAKDAKFLKLSDSDLKRFKADKANYSADFFKPNAGTTADSTLRADSVYVKAFRSEAYKSYVSKRSFGHYALLGVGAYIVISVVVALVVVVVLVGSYK